MNKLLFLPDNYIRREKPEYFNDTITKLYQPDIYTFAEKLAKGFGVNKIVDVGCGNGDRIANISSVKTIGIDYGNNIQIAKNKYPANLWVEADFEKDLNHLKFHVKNGWIICSDVIEHLINPLILLNFFSEVLPEIYGIVISTPDRDRARGKNDLGPPFNRSHTVEWTKEEFYNLLCSKNLKPLLHGFTRSVEDKPERNTQVAFIPGGLLKFSAKPINVLAIVPCFNEVDIIKTTIDNLLSQNIDVYVIDNWSTDGSWKELQTYNNVTVERFPATPDTDYNWTGILNRIDEVAANSNYDWVLHVDADEQIDSPIPGMSVKNFISIADNFGADLIDFVNIAFRPFEESNALPNFWQFSNYPADRNLHRAWKNKKQTVGLSSHGGHTIPTLNKKFPFTLILKHYPLRSPTQAKNKIFKNRLPRFSQEKKKGWHVHYDVFNEAHKFLWDKSVLKAWSEESKEEWLVEFTTKINIDFSKMGLPEGFN